MRDQAAKQPRYLLYHGFKDAVSGEGVRLGCAGRHDNAPLDPTRQHELTDLSRILVDSGYPVTFQLDVNIDDRHNSLLEGFSPGSERGGHWRRGSYQW